MKIQPDELSKHGYVLFDQFKHDDLLPFVQKYLRKRNRSITGYYSANIALTLLLTILLFNTHAIHWDKKFQHVGLGVLFAFMLIPIHEILHAIAYKICGAKKVSFDANLKQFYFMAMADQFVANRGEFIFVALAPFVTITLLGLLSLPFLSGAGMICMATCLLVHASCCAGDFSLLSFFEVQSGRDVITYDDRQKRESYFLFR